MEENKLHLCQQLFLSQTEHIACLEDIISHLRGELDFKQKVIDNLLQTLKSCLHSKSTRYDEKYFALQNHTSNFGQKNVNKSGTAIYTNKETINIDKETINNNQKRNKKCITVSNQQSNQRHTADIIEATISNAINNAQTSRNDNRNVETTWKNGSKDNNDKEKSKQVYILGDSIIKHVKGYTISSSLDNCKVSVKDFPGARVPCMQDYVRAALKENPDHIIIHVGTNDLASNTSVEKVAESIINLASTLKSDSCSVAISSITVRNDKHRTKVAQVNRSLKRLCQEKNFDLINHEKTITERHLNGSKLHLNKRGTTIFSNNFTEAISNSIQ